MREQRKAREPEADHQRSVQRVSVCHPENQPNALDASSGRGQDHQLT